MKLSNGATVLKEKSTVSGHIVLAEYHDEFVVWNIDKCGDRDRGCFYEYYDKAHNDYVSRGR